jgi:hypothetical protein
MITLYHKHDCEGNAKPCHGGRASTSCGVGLTTDQHQNVSHQSVRRRMELLVRSTIILPDQRCDIHVVARTSMISETRYPCRKDMHRIQVPSCREGCPPTPPGMESPRAARRRVALPPPAHAGRTGALRVVSGTCAVAILRHVHEYFYYYLHQAGIHHRFTSDRGVGCAGQGHYYCCR